MAQKVLIVEDSPIMGKLTTKNLETLGYETAVRKNSAEAIAYIGNNHTDMILMDIELMGSKMDGIQIARTIRSKYNIPIIFLTSHEDVKIFQDGNIASLIDVVLKPYDLRNLKMQMEISFYNNQLEKKAKELENWFGGVMEGIDDAVLALDLNLNIKYINQSAEELLGVNRSELTGKDIGDYVAFAYEQKMGFSSMTHYKEVSEIEKDKTGSKPFVVINDTKKIMAVKVKKIFNQAKEEIGYVLVISE